MILEFGAENYYSFKESFYISFKKNQTKKNDDDNILKLMCVKGANASGKTNVLKAISTISDFAKNSFNYEKSEPLPFNSYFYGINEVIKLYATFLEQDVEYTYEIEVTEKEVFKETIYRKKSRKSPIIQRVQNKIVDTTKEFEELKGMNLKSNASLISTAFQYDFKSIFPIYNIFVNILTNVDIFGRIEEQYDYLKVSEMYYNDKDLFNKVVNIIKYCDPGINDIKVYPREDKETGKTEYFPIFYYLINKEEKILTFHNQSNGIQSLYLQLGLYLYALRLGSLLVLDEFDINLHPDLLPMILSFFEEKNPNRAQLLLTTHNVEIMDKLGKYRTIFVNKEDNESFLYRLDELPGDMVRNDRPITPLYKSGRIGGRPKLKHA